MTEAEKPTEASPSGEPVARRAGIVGVFTLLSRVAGYVRDATLAHVFGASGALDAFIVAQTIPNTLRRLVAEGSLAIAFVPLLAEAREEGGHAEMRRFTATVLGALLPLLAILVALGVLYPEVAVRFFAAGFDAERAATAARLTRIMMPFIAFASLLALAGGALNTLGVFAAPAAAPILLNVVIIISALAAAPWFRVPIDAVAWGVLAGAVFQLALQIPWLARAKLLLAPRWHRGDARLRKLFLRMGPAVFGVAVYQLNIIVIRQFGSFLPEGELSWYYNATRLQEFVLGVFAVSVSVAALPTLSSHAAAKNWQRLQTTFRRAVRITNFITIPSSVAALVLAKPIVTVLFYHGQYGRPDVLVTAELLAILSVSVAPIGAVRVAVPTFYALGDTKTPVIAATLSLLATIGFGLLLLDPYAIRGLSLALTLAAFVQLLVLFTLLRRTLGRLPLPPHGEDSILVQGAKCALASVPAAVAAAVIAGSLDWFSAPRWLGLLVLAGIGILGGGLYVGAAKLLKLRELDLVTEFVARRRRR